jgi:hypothetical protein
MYCQVSINSSGAGPDASAQLDVTSEEKGLLIPRMDQQQRDNIVMPAHSLLVYQTDVVPGYYFNAGSPTTPDWQPLVSTLITSTEKRTAIDNLPFTISTSGSYYLCDNLIGQADTDGITIVASNVTLDLNGFTLKGGGGSMGEAITFPDSVGNIRISNGHIDGWGDEGINALQATNSEFSNLSIVHNKGDGLKTGKQCIIRYCNASANGADGFEIGSGSIISHSSASQNGSDGIDSGIGSVVESCTSRENSRYGFNAGAESTMIQNTSSLNGLHGFSLGSGTDVKNCTSSENQGDGFFLESGGIANNNTARGNEAYGFRWTNDNYIHHNAADSNSKSGFYTVFSDSRIEDNQSTDNSEYGYEIGGFGGCLIIRNAGSGNTLNDYSINPGHAAGPVITAAQVAINTNPSANIKY